MIITKQEVEAWQSLPRDSEDPYKLMLNTITTSVGLLEKASNDFLPANGKEVKWVREIREFLRQYHSESKGNS